MFAPLSMSNWTWACLATAAYLALVRHLRWKRYRALHAKYRNVKFHELSYQDAQKIIQLSSMWDNPSVNLYALSFALFKTYGIVSAIDLLRLTLTLASRSRLFRRSWYVPKNWRRRILSPRDMQT
jgi:hypothetical protein